MSFRFHAVDGGHNPPHEYLEAEGLTPKVGMALKLSGGKLVTAAGSDVPTYISMTERQTPCAAGELIPVVRISGEHTYETSFSAAATAVKLGDKLTISADGLEVTATKGGAAEVTAIDGTDKGGICRVRFGPADAAE